LQVDSSDPGLTTEFVRMLIQDDQTQEAEARAKDLIDRQKTSFSQIYDLMYPYYYNRNRIAEAEKVLKEKVNNNPKNATYTLQLARHYARVQKPQEMKSTLQRLLDDPKDFPEARMWVGNYYMAIRSYDEAIRNYEEGARSHSNPKQRAEYQRMIMVAWLAQGKTDEATSVAGELLKQDPQNEEALRLQADSWLTTGKPDRIEAALRTFETLSGRHPEDPVLRYLLGRSYRIKGDLDAARTQLSEAIKRRKDFLRARYELGEVDLLQQRPKEALLQANEIRSLKPNDVRKRRWA
jgi:tetratricopeptide (TPR) repeat protein